jgi:hypothetical protein
MNLFSVDWAQVLKSPRLNKIFFERNEGRKVPASKHALTISDYTGEETQPNICFFAKITSWF